MREKESRAPSSPPLGSNPILPSSPSQERRLGTRLRRGGGDRSSGTASCEHEGPAGFWPCRPSRAELSGVGRTGSRRAGIRKSKGAPGPRRKRPCLRTARVNRPGAALVLRRKHQRVLRRKHGRISTVPGRKARRRPGLSTPSQGKPRGRLIAPRSHPPVSKGGRRSSLGLRSQPLVPSPQSPFPLNTVP